jgi:NDP-mannose synthase
MKVVILAGGKGARLAPYTKILPKPLMPIGDMPILEVMLLQMKKAGISEAILTVGHLAELLQAFFQGGERLGLKISYSIEDAPLGTAGPLSLVADRLEETFIVANGDVLTTLDWKKLIKAHKGSGAVATIASHARQVKVDLGVLQFKDTHPNETHEIAGYIEKPTYDFQVSMGIYIFEPAVLRYIPHNKYLDFPDLILKMLAAGEKIMGYPYDGYWQDLGRPDDYEQAIMDFEKMQDRFLPED